MNLSIGYLWIRILETGKTRIVTGCVTASENHNAHPVAYRGYKKRPGVMPGPSNFRGQFHVVPGTRLNNPRCNALCAGP